MTSTQTKFVIAGLGGSWISLLWAGRTMNKAYEELKEKHNYLIEEHNELRIQLAKSSYMLLYLAKKIQDNGGELDEFDMIALNDPPALTSDFKMDEWIARRKADPN